MRAVLFLIALAACGPKVDPKTPSTSFDEDLGAAARAPAEAPAAPVEPPRPVAPPGKGLRNGTIDRARLLAVLDAGPASFLRELEVTPHKDGDRFVGWRLVQVLDHTGPLQDLDLAPGDVLLAINGQPLSRPDQLQAVWDSLRTCNEVVADLWRGHGKFQIAFQIQPSVASPGK